MYRGTAGRRARSLRPRRSRGEAIRRPSIPCAGRPLGIPAWQRPLAPCRRRWPRSRFGEWWGRARSTPASLPRVFAVAGTRRAARIEADGGQMRFPRAGVEVLPRARRRFGGLGSCNRRRRAKHLADGGLHLSTAAEDQGRQGDEQGRDRRKRGHETEPGPPPGGRSCRCRTPLGMLDPRDQSASGRCPALSPGTGQLRTKPPQQIDLVHLDPPSSGTGWPRARERSASSAARIRPRARESRERTVPVGTSSANAISG